MTANQWPDDATLDALFDAARATRSQALRFDPEAPGGFRVLTDAEDAELVRVIALPDQRLNKDREHLTRERDDALRIGDREGADTAVAHLEALDDEHHRDQRYDPTPEAVLGPDVPTRAELDAMAPRGRDEARTWELLDARREIADQRARADAAGDIEQVHDLDQEERAVTDTWRAHHDLYVEIDEEDRERG